jgi:hypothetical protein
LVYKVFQDADFKIPAVLQLSVPSDEKSRCLPMLFKNAIIFYLSRYDGETSTLTKASDSPLPFGGPKDKNVVVLNECGLTVVHFPKGSMKTITI